MKNWFVTCIVDGIDQSRKFFKEGIWEHNSVGKVPDLVRSIQIDDRIVMHIYSRRKEYFPFKKPEDYLASVMSIQAIGKVIQNNDDGKRLRVKWIKYFDPPREWYFYTRNHTVWQVDDSNNWRAKHLIAFAFEGVYQDIDRFRNSPYWKMTLGDINNQNSDFQWTPFYEAVANGLLKFKNRREELVADVNKIASKHPDITVLTERYSDGSKGSMKDICPFTIIGMFNRGILPNNRKTLAGELAKLLQVSEEIPTKFEGIPKLNNQNSWFFQHQKDRGETDIDLLWDVFEKALNYERARDEESRVIFVSAYDSASRVKGVKWTFTSGLYWIRPWFFPTLDSKSRKFLKQQFKVDVGSKGAGKFISGQDYVDLMDRLENFFQDDDCPVHSFPELSSMAYDNKPIPNQEKITSKDSYSVEDIVNDGCFIERKKIEGILSRWTTKKNLILQGPPGTGKTWLAKRLAYAIMGKKDMYRMRSFQFHPNLSYEDFVRGWRPSADGKLDLVDGPFLKLCKDAQEHGSEKFVVVIEEINRGNPAQIFGELLTLIEADKRNQNEALQLSHGRDDERVHIPENVYVIGTMNVADRSLALVDIALRRRFAFVDLEPELGKLWRDWILEEFDVDTDQLSHVEARVTALNDEISNDPGLGAQYRIGHSFITPTESLPDGDIWNWFCQVVETEIGPLLDELWFDNPAKSRETKNRLLKRIGV